MWSPHTHTRSNSYFVLGWNSQVSATHCYLIIFPLAQMPRRGFYLARWRRGRKRKRTFFSPLSGEINGTFSSEISAFLCISETVSCCMLPYWIFMLFVLRIVFYNSQNFAHFPSFGVLCSLEKLVFKKKIRANFKYIKNNYSLVILQLQHRSGRKSFFGLPPTPGWGKKIWSVSYPWLGGGKDLVCFLPLAGGKICEIT